MRTRHLSSLTFWAAKARPPKPSFIHISQTSIKVDQNLDYITPLCSSCQGVTLVHGRTKLKGESWKLKGERARVKPEEARLMASCLSPPDQGGARRELHIFQGAAFMSQVDEIAPHRPIQAVTEFCQTGHIPGLEIVLTTLGHCPEQARTPPAPLKRTGLSRKASSIAAPASASTVPSGSFKGAREKSG